MAYGLEVKTSEGYKVLDENNEVMVVAKKGTIEGTRSTTYVPADNYADSAGKWIRVRTNTGSTLQPNWVVTSYRAHITLDNYTEKPIIALRGKGGNPTTLPTVNIRRLNGYDNRVLIQAASPVSIDYIVLAPVSSTTPTVLGGNYGFQINNASGNTIFDSRWEELTCCIKAGDFPSISNGVNYRTSGVPTSGTIAIPDGEGGDFYVTDSTYGYHNVRSWASTEEGFTSYFYGGYFNPSLKTSADGQSVIPTMVSKFLDETNVTATETSSGGVTTSTATGGTWMAIRYLNF